MRWTRDTLVHVGKRISTPHVAGCKALDTKSRGRDEVVDLAVEMTTTADAFPARGEAISAGRSGRDSVDSGSRSLGSPNPFLAPAGVLPCSPLPLLRRRLLCRFERALDLDCYAARRVRIA